MQQKKELTLKVMEALQEEVYKGIVRIDSETMHLIDVRPGDIVEIEGSRITVGIVDRAYPTDVGQAVIRMDGILRRNARTGIGEIVKVRKADIKEAKTLVIAPAQEGIMIQANPEIFKRNLLGRAVVKGDILVLGGPRRRRRPSMDPSFDDIMGVFEETFIGNFNLGNIKFIVVDTNPKSAVILSENTQISISSKSVEIKEEKVPEVTYEDLGGLEEEIKKIREMVELPLKHPEIFTRLGIDPPSGVLLHGPPGSGKTLLAKAVANESEANFILVNGPEIMNKFYGECVSEDSLVITNGTGLTTISEAVNNKNTHKIVGLNMDKQKIELLPISDVYDKGVQKTLKISTPHGMIELTPTSKLLILDGIEPKWILTKDLKINDKVAIANTLPEINEDVPNILDFVGSTTKFSGEWVRDLINLHGTNKDVAKILNVKTKKIEDMKYNRSAPLWVIKKLYKTGFIEYFNLTGKGRIPSAITKDLMYVIGLIAGDGHLRYNYKDDGVSTISLTNIDKKVISEFKRLIKGLFGIQDVKYDGHYSYYFSSRPIGNLIKNLGIPIRNKSKTITVPSYLITLPKEYIASYLRGLFDTDGHVHIVPSGMQISYYSSSRQMVNGVKYLLLRFQIQSTFRYKKDGTYELTINDIDSLKKFNESINFNHEKRKQKLKNIPSNKYDKPIYNRIPINEIVNKIKNKHSFNTRELIKVGLNPYVKSYTRTQTGRFISLLKDMGENCNVIEKINKLKTNDVIWSPIKFIQESESHVYDFTVPKDHNFIANGFIVHNSEKRIRDIFEDAEHKAPSIIFIDEIDAIAPKREETHGEVERRVVAQILTAMDGLKTRKNVVVIGATNRPNALDPALRRPGRFDREISIGVPNKKGRLEILKIHTRNMPLAEDVKLDKLSEITHGFVGADISALVKEAAMNVLRRILPDINLKEKEPIPNEMLEKLKVAEEDFREALKIVRPSALREVLIENPNVHWSDIGGLETLKNVLKETIEWPMKYANEFKKLGIIPPRGILLYGPPGTGKTLLAKAVATESQSNFISVKGPALVNMWVGESERGVRKIFEKARQAAPTVIFFDEIDSIAPRRSIGGGVTKRIVNTILSEMDGLEKLNEVIVIAATNRPDILDPALLRPGRFEKVIPINMPDKKSRLEIFKVHTSKMAVAKDVSIEKLAEITENYSGADIEAACREAGMSALRNYISLNEKTNKTTKKSKSQERLEINFSDFQEAIKRIKPSITPEELKKYQEIEDEYIRIAKTANIKQAPQPYFG